MREIIVELKNALGASEKKWERVMKNIMRENVELKYEN